MSSTVKADPSMPSPTVLGTIIDQELNALHGMIAAELRKHPPGFLLAVSPRAPKLPEAGLTEEDSLKRDLAPIDPTHLPVVLPDGWQLYGPLQEAEVRPKQRNGSTEIQ